MEMKIILLLLIFESITQQGVSLPDQGISVQITLCRSGNPREKVRETKKKAELCRKNRLPG